MKAAPALAAVVVFTLATISCSSTPGRPEAARAESAQIEPQSFEIRVVLVEAPSATLAPWIAAGEPASQIVATETADAMLATLRKDGHVTTRPMIVVRAGGTAHISNSTKVGYVQDFTPDAKPVNATVEEGCWISATPTHGADERTDVAFSIESAKLVRPIREAKTTLPGSTQELTLQLPVVIKRTCTSRVALSKDQVALLPMVPMGTPEDDNVCFAVLRVRPSH